MTRWVWIPYACCSLLVACNASKKMEQIGASGAMKASMALSQTEEPKAQAAPTPSQVVEMGEPSVTPLPEPLEEAPKAVSSKKKKSKKKKQSFAATMSADSFAQFATSKVELSSLTQATLGSSVSFQSKDRKEPDSGASQFLTASTWNPRGISSSTMATIGNMESSHANIGGISSVAELLEEETTEQKTIKGRRIPHADVTIASMQGSFRTCYQEDAEAKPGSVRMTAIIGAMGDVVSVVPSGTMGLSSAIVSCVANTIMQTRFNAPGGSGSVIVIPVAFAQQ